MNLKRRGVRCNHSFIGVIVINIVCMFKYNISRFLRKLMKMSKYEN